MNGSRSLEAERLICRFLLLFLISLARISRKLHFGGSSYSGDFWECFPIFLTLLLLSFFYVSLFLSLLLSIFFSVFKAVEPQLYFYRIQTNISRWIKIEIKRTAEIAPRHRSKTEICARSACFRPARVALMAKLARDEDRWIEIWRLLSGAARVWQPSRAERSGPTAERARSLLAVVPRGTQWLVWFRVSCFGARIWIFKRFDSLISVFCVLFRIFLGILLNC